MEFDALALDGRATIVIAVLVLFIGKWLSARATFLRKYSIPESVSGGLFASSIFGLVTVLLDFKVSFDLAIRDELLILFFTTVGLSSKLSTLAKGGKQLCVLLLIAACFLVLQTGTGVLIALLNGDDPLVGVMGGSVSLAGGHGTAIAWAPIFDSKHSLPDAMELGVASATFGLVLGGVLGGPLARSLVHRFRLESRTQATLSVGVEQNREAEVPIDYDRMLGTILLTGITVGLGLAAERVLSSLALQLPTFVYCLFAGILVTNSAPLLTRGKTLPQPENSRSLALVADVSLGLFLAMTLMSLEVQTLTDIGFGFFTILLAQCLLAIVWSYFVVFRLMGSDYDAAVISSGFVGLSLGATPTAIANMTAVTSLYGASPSAFIIVPLVGAFFIDIVNTFVIQLFIYMV